MTIPRIYLQQPLRAGDVCTASDELERYIKLVLRMRTGDPLFVFDGTGWQYEAVVRQTTKGIALEVNRGLALPSDRIEITLCQAIPKADKMGTIIRHATELGAGRIIPFFAERSIPRWSSEKSPQKRARWQKIAIESSRQCGRADIPEISEIKQFAEMLRLAPPRGRNLIFWEEGSGRGIREVLREPEHDGATEFLLVIGPEGGFVKDEIDQARHRGFLPVSLGRRVLRVDTAALTVLAVLQYEKGNLGGSDREGLYG